MSNWGDATHTLSSFSNACFLNSAKLDCDDGMMGRDAGVGSAQPGDWGTFDVAVVVLLVAMPACVCIVYEVMVEICDKQEVGLVACHISWGL